MSALVPVPPDLHKGDLVTFVLDGRTEQGHVLRALDEQYGRAQLVTSDRGGGAFRYTISYEGISWIRGHHEPGSEEADALLAAFALALLP